MSAPDPFVVRVDTGDEIHALEWGMGRGVGPPCYLLVHGLAQTAWAWAPVARRLAGSARVLAPDLRGHGGSAAPRSGYDAESLAWDVLTVASAAGFGEAVGGPPVILAGHGTGAIVAAVAAMLAPGSVAGLALVDGGWEALGEATGLSVEQYVAALAEPPEVLRSIDTFLADRRALDPATRDADPFTAPGDPDADADPSAARAPSSGGIDPFAADLDDPFAPIGEDPAAGVGRLTPGDLDGLDEQLAAAFGTQPPRGVARSEPDADEPVSGPRSPLVSEDDRAAPDELRASVDRGRPAPGRDLFGRPLDEDEDPPFGARLRR